MILHPGTRRLLTWLVIPLALALPFSLFASYAALEHNPQEEFCTYVASRSEANYTAQGAPCSIKWGEIGLIFGSWLVPQFLLWTIAHIAWAGRRRAQTRVSHDEFHR